MTTELETEPVAVEANALTVRFPLTDDELAKIKETLTGLTVAKDGYETVRKGIASTRELRSKVEAKRKELLPDLERVAAWGEYLGKHLIEPPYLTDSELTKFVQAQHDKLVFVIGAIRFKGATE